MCSSLGGKTQNSSPLVRDKRAHLEVALAFVFLFQLFNDNYLILFVYHIFLFGEPELDRQYTDKRIKVIILKHEVTCKCSLVALNVSLCL